MLFGLRNGYYSASRSKKENILLVARAALSRKIRCWLVGAPLPAEVERTG